MQEKGRGLRTAQPAREGGRGGLRTVTPHLEASSRAARDRTVTPHLEASSRAARDSTGRSGRTRLRCPLRGHLEPSISPSLARPASRQNPSVRAPPPPGSGGLPAVARRGTESLGTQQLPKPALLPTAGWREEFPNTEAAVVTKGTRLSMSRGDVPGLSVAGHSPVSSQE